MKKLLLLVLLLCCHTNGLFAQAGTLDASFGANGISNVPGTSGIGEVARAVTVLDNGKILAAGERLGRACVKRYNSDGTLDATFGGQGEVSNAIGYPHHNPTNITIQPDGKILVCGHTNAKNVFLARFTANGTIDVDFGTNGAVYFYPGAASGTIPLIPHCATVLTDGKIIVTGLIAGAENTWGIFAVKFNADGIVDTTYGYEGYVGEAASQYPSSSVCYPDGKTVFAIFTTATSFIGTFTTLKRFDETGVLDPTFGQGGIVQLTNGELDYAIRDMVLQADGKIVAGGGSSTSETTGAEFAITRLNYDGTPDLTFGLSGTVIPFNPGGEEIFKITVHSDGMIVGAGQDNSSNNFNVVRFNSTGMQDMSFGVNGVAKTSLGSYYHQVNDVTVQPDGKIIVAGMVLLPTSEEYNFLLLRYLGSNTTASLNNNTLTQISLYPNPTSSTLNLANAENLNIESLTVTDMTGKVVLLQKDNNAQLNVEKLPQGMYFLTVSSKEGIQNLKFIKE
ncbi:T9SS type A sorting domain-containing protein [Flavobacterium hauense]